MKPEGISQQASAATVRPLKTALPSVPPPVARAARIGFDRRFPAWLRSLGQQRVPVSAGRPDTASRVMELSCAHGSADIAFDPQQWPALKMAADLDDAELSRAVANALMAPLAQAASRALPGAQVRSFKPHEPDAATASHVPTLVTRGGPVSLLRVDAALAQHLEAYLRTAFAADMRPLRRLSLVARLQWLQRPFSTARLRALTEGDIVLCGAARRAGTRWRAKLLFGLGMTMQTDVEIDIEAARAHVTAPPHVADDDAAGAVGNDELADLADLQVPVSFEVDSARVTLGELAALGPGSVIELATPLQEATVRLVCQGQTVGIGQLVAVGDQLGVRIARIGLERTQP